jgi:virginiamycin B lyase
MTTHLSTQRSPSHYLLLFVSLLTLVGILGGCGASSTAGPSLQSGSTSTSTPTQKLKGTIGEFSLPDPDFRPGDITAGPDGNTWFTTLGTKPQTGKLGRISPAGVVSEFSLPLNSFSNSITAGQDGNFWIKEPGEIGRISPTGMIREFPLSSSSLVDTLNWPNTLSGSTIWGAITTGPDGALWFTEPGPLTQNGKIGRITPSGTIREFPLPTPSGGPGGITVGLDGKLWFTEMLSNKIGRLV